MQNRRSVPVLGGSGFIGRHVAAALCASGCLSRPRLPPASCLRARGRGIGAKPVHPFHGEEALRNSGADWHIVRPSLLDGDGGFGAEWLRRVSRWSVHPLPASSTGRLAVLDVRDLGEHLDALRRQHAARPAWRLPIPDLLARLGSHLCDLLHFSPYSYGHWKLLRRDNCPQRNQLPELLGRAPRTVGCSVDRDAEEAAVAASPLQISMPDPHWT